MLSSESVSPHYKNPKKVEGPILTSTPQQSTFGTCPIGNPKSSNTLAYPEHSLPQVPVLQINDVAIQFLRQYYTMLSRETDKVHFFYKDQSYSQHGLEGDQEVPLCFGLEKIHHRINSLGYFGCRIFISNIDSQTSINGGIMIVAVGRIQLKNGSIKRFAHTVFLAEQPSGYYVLNDIFRFINNENESSVSFGASFPTFNQNEENSMEKTLKTHLLASSFQKDETEVQFKMDSEDTLISPVALNPIPDNISPKNRDSKSEMLITSAFHQVNDNNSISKPDLSITMPTECSGFTCESNQEAKCIEKKAPFLFVKKFSELHKKPFNPASSIYIGGLKMEPKPSETSIREIFSIFGDINLVDWGKDCAYVEFVDPEVAQNLHSKIVNVCGVSVKILPRRYMPQGQGPHFRHQKGNPKRPNQE
jgi:hypothetical protein